MNRLKLIALSLAGLHRLGYCTANTQAEDIAALQKQVADLAAQNAALSQQLSEQKNAASRVVNGDELELGPFRLPEGIEAKDVLWRKRAGLDTKQAVQAAIAQKKHDDALAAAEKAAKAEKK